MSIFPSRVITYAWGDIYVDDLLNVTIPALLAPGNLPYVASQIPCELVILTEERMFPRIKTHPTIQRSTGICPLRLIGIDDLVTDASRYGMALTYTLHRGFADLGAAMMDTYLMFLNADFVVADGCLRNVLARLQRGERIIAAPSYCAVAPLAKSELKKRVDKNNALVVPPREMAEICLKYRHNTIRGKTVNKRNFHVRYMDQFYWEVDERTLIAYQMPIAIVGMRPERHIVEPNSYWDYGLMKEFVPESEINVIGDSDEFMMLELREKEVANEQISSNWPTPDQIASDMVVFLTDYQRNFAQYPLTLHADEIPQEVNKARKELRDFVHETLSYLPDSLPSHVGHPQWDYHFPRFIEARHSYLSAALGPLTEFEPPPIDMSLADKLWWQFDGAKKRRAHQLEQITTEKESLIALLRSSADRELEKVRIALLSALSARPDFITPRSHTLFANEVAAVDDSKTTNESEHGAIHRYFDSLRQCSEKVYADQYKVEQQIRQIDHYFDQRLRELDKQVEALGLNYEKLIEQRVVSAVTPYIKVLGEEQNKFDRPGRLGHSLYYRIIGRLPCPKFLNPYWSPFYPIRRLIKEFEFGNPINTLVVSNLRSGFSALTSDVPGLRIALSRDGLLSRNLSKASQELPKFDLCICELLSTDWSYLPEIIDAARAQMRVGATILCFHLIPSVWHDSLPDLVSNTQFGDRGDQVRIIFAGSSFSAYALSIFQRGARYVESNGPLKLLRFAVTLAIIQPLVWVSNFVEKLRSTSRPKRPRHPTSIILEIKLGR